MARYSRPPPAPMALTLDPLPSTPPPNASANVNTVVDADGVDENANVIVPRRSRESFAPLPCA
jgi:hypothetical protein